MEIIKNLVTDIVKPIIFDLSDFLPPDVSELHLWDDANDPNTITESGGAISKVDDKSEQGNDATQNTGSRQPMIVPSAINGLSAISFDGTNDFLFLPPILDPATTDFTIFIVAQFNNSLSALTLLSQRDNGGTGRTILRADTNNRLASNLGSAIGKTGQTINFNPQIYVLQLDGTTLTFRTDGSSPIIHTITPETALGDWVIGVNKNLNTQFMDGLIGEIIIYAKSVLSEESQLLHNYLTLKWGLFEFPIVFSSDFSSDFS